MAQPVAFTPATDYSDYQTNNPGSFINGAHLDTDLGAIKTTTDQIRANLALIQRDDGELANLSVHLDALDTDVRALLASTESTVRGAWLTATSYAIGDVVTQSGVTYLCFEAHTSGVFATDFAATKWASLSGTATGTAFTPAGTVAATTVQNAIEELDSEKLPAMLASETLGDVLTYNGSAWINRSLGVIYPQDYGAVGDDSTDDTTAFTNALAASASSGKPIYVPPGTYKLTGTIGYTNATIIHMYGAGPDKSVLKMYTDNTPILNVGYGRSRVADLSLQYSSAQAIGNTNANCIQFYATNYSVFERLTFYRCNRGMYIPQVAAYTGSNYIFSCTIRDILCTYYSNNGMDLTCYNGGSSGNVMSNIYLLGRDDAATKLETNFALALGGWANSVITQLNIESSKPTQALYLNSCEAMMFDGLHFEQVECRTDYGGLVEISGGAHEFRGVHVAFCQISVTNLLALFRLTAVNTKVRAVNVQERDNTITSTHWRLFLLPGTETGVEAYCEMLVESDFTSLGSSASYPSKIRQVGTVNNVIDIGGNSVISASSVPSSGTWVAGDKCFNSAPGSGRVFGWVCTTGGSPGTWQAFGILEGLTAYDANTPFTLTAGTSAPTAFAFGTLTADRAVSLAGGFKGAKFRVTRTAGGAFNLNVGTGPLKALAASEWCDVEHDGSSWVLTAFGSL